ncbi:MAG TPA: glycosyltransferase family 39 protein [Candidatus Dormibacteraeota bacterium]
MLTTPAPTGRLERSRPTLSSPMLPWLGIGAAALLFAVFGAGYDIVTPFAQAPDEGSHIGYAQLLAQHFQLPVGQPERQQPPLYYLLGALLLKAGAGSSSLEALAIVFGMLTVFVAAFCAREIWPDRPSRWVLVALLVGAIPQVQFIAAHASNDSLTMLLAGLLLLLLIRVIKRAPGWREVVLIGLAISASLMVKETIYYLAATLAIAALISVKGRRTRLLALVALAGIPLLLTGWWFVRNLTTFGHLLPDLRPVYTAHPNHLILDATQLRTWSQFFFQSFFARLGNMSSLVTVGTHPYVIYHLLELLTGFVIVAGALAAAEGARRSTSLTRVITVLLVAIPLVALAQAVLNSFFIDDQPQGRYLFLALPAMAIIAVFGIDHWADRLKPLTRAAVWGAFVAAALAFDVLSLATASRLFGAF